MRRYGLRDDQWERICNLLPGRDGHVGVTARDNRLFVEAVLYRFRAGVPWRDLAERFGDGVKVHRRFSRWAKSGVWERVFQHLAADADNEYAMIDSTIVRAHQHSAGAPKKGALTKRSGARAEGRFAIGRVCVVADRGMICAATIAALEARGLEYLLGARERTDKVVRTIVLKDETPSTPLCIQRAGGEETQLFVKEVTAKRRRYIVCLNEAEARKDAADRRAVVAALDEQLKRGEKALIGNRGYRRY